MEMQRCLEILELPKDSSIEEVHQTYKDMVNIWHPDRVGDNPRLKKKAGEKMKTINIAYEELNSFLSSRPKTRPTVQKTPSEQSKTEVFHSAERAKTEIKKAPKPNVEIQPKANFFSSLWTFLSKALDALNAAQGSSNEPMRTRTTPFEPTGGQRQNKGRSMGRGKGMGGGERGGGPTKLTD